MKQRITAFNRPSHPPHPGTPARQTFRQAFALPGHGILLAAALLVVAFLQLQIPAQAQTTGESPAEAHDLGVLIAPQTLNGRVNADHPQDHYRFEVTDSVRVVNLLIPQTSLSGYVDLIIAQDRNENFVIEDNEILAGDRGYRNGTATIQIWLNPGQYYARVQVVPGYDTPYSLTLSQSPRPASAGAGDDSIPLALQRPAMTPGVAIKDFVGLSDTIDIHHFEVTNEVHEVRLVIPQTSMSGYLTLSLAEDLNGNLLADTDEILGPVTGYHGSTAAIQLWLNPGRYLVMVRAYPNYQTPYDLTLSLTRKPASGGRADDTIAQSFERPPMVHAQTVADYVGYNDPVDVYRFEVVGSVAEVQAILPKASLNGYATLSLIRDANGNGVVEESEILDASNGYSGSDARVDAWLDPGVYFLRVAAYPGYSPNYSLTLAQSAKPRSLGLGDNEPASPGHIGHVTAPVMIDDYVGTSDVQDFYRFDVTGPVRKVTAMLPRENLSGYAILRLMTDANQDGILEDLAQDNGYSGANAIIERELGPGRYFISVARYPGYSTPYRLVVSRVFTGDVPPFVVVAPVQQIVAAGKPATFSVQGDGSGTLQYQWLLDDQPIPGATGPTLTLTDRITEVRDYRVSVRITNAAGQVVTEPIRLQVTPADLQLGIARAVLLSWPLAGSEGYVVQGAPSPDGPWSPLTSREVVVHGNRRELTIDDPARFGFFRLVKP